MTSSRRYLALSFLIVMIAVWASENLFWSAPPDDLTPLSLVLTWGVYSLCAAASLSAVILTGVGGWKALFLGGALLGWLVEGVVVSTMYDAFPLQIVWTGLAWHALLTCLVVFGLGRAAVHWPLWKQSAAWVLVGLFGAAFALYWPLERAVIPGMSPTALYIFGLGLAVPVAHSLIDRLELQTMPPRKALLVAPALLACVWLGKLLVWFNPLMLVLPPLIVLTIWTMFSHGGAPRMPYMGKPVSFGRHLLFLLAPAVCVIGAVTGWSAIGGLETNIPIALATSLTGFSLYVWLGVQGWRNVRRARQP